MIRRIAAASAAVALVLTASSCAKDDTSAQKPGTSAVPSYASSNDDHGAQQFASYWVDTLNKATVTGKTAQLKSLATKDCARCADFAKQLDDIYASGGHVTTQGWKVQTVVPERGLPAGQRGLSVKVKTTPQEVQRSKDAKVQKLTGGALTLRMILVRNGDTWALQSLDV